MSVFATATGIGSWPGTAAREAAQVVVGELAGALAYLTELPARGVGADMLGRAGGLLVDVAIDTVPRGYRIAARPGAVTRRAASLLDEDMDALEEAWETAGLRGCGRAVKVQGGVVSPQARLVSAVEPAPASTSVSVLASDRGAGALGFVGTAGKESVGQPAGLTVLADEFGDGAPVPMLPGSWGPDLVGVAGDGGLVSV